MAHVPCLPTRTNLLGRKLLGRKPSPSQVRDIGFEGPDSEHLSAAEAAATEMAAETQTRAQAQAPRKGGGAGGRTGGGGKGGSGKALRGKGSGGREGGAQHAAGGAEGAESNQSRRESRGNGESRRLLDTKRSPVRLYPRRGNGVQTPAPGSHLAAKVSACWRKGSQLAAKVSACWRRAPSWPTRARSNHEPVRLVSPSTSASPRELTSPLPLHTNRLALPCSTSARSAPAPSRAARSTRRA
jgi:hypothetical protein